VEALLQQRVLLLGL